MGLISRLWSPAYVRDLNTPLLRLSRNDALRASDLYEHILITGATGSGKTSSSGAAISYAALRAGAGFLVCTAKRDEADLWRQRARRVGRERDVIVIDGSGRHKINFLQYMMHTSPDAGALIMNTVNALSTVIMAVNGKTDQGGGDNQFWQKAMKEAFTHSLAVLWAAYGRLNLYDLFARLHSRPLTYDQAKDPHWHDTSFMAQTLHRAEDQPAHPMHPMDFRASFNYLTQTLANPDSRTTGNILATISADLAPLMQGKMRELFCTDTTVVPEMTHDGAIILIDLPVIVWEDAGLLAQHVFKYLFQKATESRIVTSRTRPVILWCDEAHFFLSPHDAKFLATARSAKAGTVYLTQNIPGLYSRMGAQHHDSVDAMLGNFQFKCFHGNTCSRTNEWASTTIGRGLQVRWNGGVNDGWNDTKSYGFGGGSSSSPNGQGTSHSDNYNRGRSMGRSGGTSVGYSEQMDFFVQPSDFISFRKGGRANGGLVDGLILRGGGVFRHSGRPYLPVVFRQS